MRSTINVANLYLKPVSTDQRLTVEASAVQLSAFSETCEVVMFQVQAADVYCTVDASTPTTSNGFLLAQNTSYNWSKSMAKAAKFVSAGTATIHAQGCAAL